MSYNIEKDPFIDSLQQQLTRTLTKELSDKIDVPAEQTTRAGIKEVGVEEAIRELLELEKRIT